MTLLQRLQNSSPYVLSALRIVAAIMFMQAGTVKLFAWPIAMPPGHEATIWSQVWIGGVLEAGGGLLLLVGWYTRLTAFVLSGMMAVAYFQFHQPAAFWPVENGGMPAVLYCWLWLYFVAAGAGPISIDAWLARRRSSQN